MKRLAVFALALATPAAFAQEDGNWVFSATLDGKPIGTHRFVVSVTGAGAGEGSGAARSVASHAEFVVRLFGIPVYRYSHHADERWQGDCLRQLRSDTDDDGQRQHVAQDYDTDCLMGFAYWNPRLVQQRQLIDPQTGRAGPARFEPLPEASIDLRGRPVAARGWRLVTDKQRITVWYAVDGGRWIGLDAEVKGGRRLSYRLPPDEASTTRSST